MGLKDLKSDLSKFRIPKKTNLVNKSVRPINTKPKTTSLSDLQSPNISHSTDTPKKEGQSVSKMNNDSKFMGDSYISKMNNDSNFLGGTDINPLNNKAQFLGETTINPLDNKPQYIGETNVSPLSNDPKFLGETSTIKLDSKSNFLGGTLIKDFKNDSQFLGETNTLPFDKSSKFLGETPKKPLNQKPQNLGEVKIYPLEKPSKFLGETNVIPLSNDSNFLGGTNVSTLDNSSNFLGGTNVIPLSNDSNFLGESELGTVNVMSDIHAKGFTSNFNNITDTKYTGINSTFTNFDTTNSKYSDTNKSKFRIGNTYENVFINAGGLESGEIGFGIGKEHGRRRSPSFLDKQYNKFNLKRDSYNSQFTLFRHPLILRGIQRAGVDNKKPQYWGFGIQSFDDGLVRGGAAVSTERALIDVARIGMWLGSAKGGIWVATQTGLQRTNKYGKIWTPAPMLAAVGAQHLGIKPERVGILPFTNNESYKYSSIVKNDKLNIPQKYQYEDIKSMYGVAQKGNLGQLTLKTDKLGGFDSFYGIGTSETKTSIRTIFNTMVSDSYFGNGDTIDNFDTDSKSGYYSGINSLYENYIGVEPPYKLTLGKLTTFDLMPTDKTGLKIQPAGDGSSYTKTTRVFDTTFEASKAISINADNSIIKDGIYAWETLPYKKLLKEFKDSSYNDFRFGLSQDNPNHQLAIKEGYNFKNIETNTSEFGAEFGNPGKVGKNLKEIYSNTDAKKVLKINKDLYDKLNADGVDSDEHNDLVKFIIKAEGGKSVQFRGTIVGLNDTFSPGWESFKYNGRADQSYKYGTFERGVSFNFKVYATSRVEMKPIWDKLNYLSTMTMPEYKGPPGYQGVLVYFTIGDLYVKKLAFIESLSYGVPDDTPWDINNDNELAVLPMGVEVNISFKILDNNRPELGQKVYDANFINTNY